VPEETAFAGGMGGIGDKRRRPPREDMLLGLAAEKGANQEREKKYDLGVQIRWRLLE